MNHKPAIEVECRFFCIVKRKINEERAGNECFFKYEA
ncbi:hypothetical protein SAMN05518848_104332 [Paenibacillus sp. PDC88]|nr:hypothetical protein SAMN05518848_104332 [Paenibacillus sp. PDC88]